MFDGNIHDFFPTDKFILILIVTQFQLTFSFQLGKTAVNKAIGEIDILFDSLNIFC